jgi:hypothetical protein
MITCPHCKFRELEGSLFCSSCGSPLIEEQEKVSTTGDLSKATAAPPSSPPLVGKRTGPAPDVKAIRFVILSSGRQATLGLQQKIHLGRCDPSRDAHPELDLTDDGGAEAGVSRLHAVVSATMQGISIMDLGSANGTWVNGYRLEPNLPFALNDGDKLELGNQEINVFFEG